MIQNKTAHTFDKPFGENLNDYEHIRLCYKRSFLLVDDVLRRFFLYVNIMIKLELRRPYKNRSKWCSRENLQKKNKYAQIYTIESIVNTVWMGSWWRDVHHHQPSYLNENIDSDRRYKQLISHMINSIDLYYNIYFKRKKRDANE